MSKQCVLVAAPDMGGQLVWNPSGDGIVGKGACRWCAYTGQEEEAARDWGWLEALHPDDRERARQLWLQAGEQKRFYETWYRIRNHEGLYQTFFYKIYARYGPDRHPERMDKPVCPCNCRASVPRRRWVLADQSAAQFAL